MTDWFGLERTLKITQPQPLPWAVIPPAQAAQSPPMALVTSRDGAHTDLRAAVCWGFSPCSVTACPYRIPSHLSWDPLYRHWKASVWGFTLSRKTGALNMSLSDAQVLGPKSLYCPQGSNARSTLGPFVSALGTDSFSLTGDVEQKAGCCWHAYCRVFVELVVLWEPLGISPGRVPAPDVLALKWGKKWKWRLLFFKDMQIRHSGLANRLEIVNTKDET